MMRQGLGPKGPCEPSQGVQTLCKEWINCNTLGILDFLIYKMRVG